MIPALKFIALAVILNTIGFKEATFDSKHIRRVTLPRRSTEYKTIPPADFTVPIMRKTKRTQAKRDSYNALMRAHGHGHTVSLAGSKLDQQYLVNVTVGGQHFAMFLDTGSSDTWLPKTTFNCRNIAFRPEPLAKCAFGPLYDPYKSPTYKPLPNLNFNITYGTGEHLLGIAANESVSVAGLTVPEQEIGVATEGSWLGDGIGLIGFAFPEITSVYPGTDPLKDELVANNVKYDPFFFSAVREKLVRPSFSIALNRASFKEESKDKSDPHLGYLSLGGLPPVPVTSITTTVPIQAFNVATRSPSNASGAVDVWYALEVQSFAFPGSEALNNTSTNDIILDTGNPFNLLPLDVANAYAASFSPPARPNSDGSGTYNVACNATIPEFNITINGVTFSVDKRDQIIPTDAEGECISGTVGAMPNALGTLFALGDVFLHNVVTTFNVESREITITQRKSY